MSATDTRGRDFGKFLRHIRTDIYEESLRAFAKRVKMSPSYLNKMELAEVATPRRDTVVAIAGRLGMEPDALLLKAGFVPDSEKRGENDEFLLLLLRDLSADQQKVVVSFISFVKDNNVTLGDNTPS